MSRKKGRHDISIIILILEGSKPLYGLSLQVFSIFLSRGFIKHTNLMVRNLWDEKQRLHQVLSRPYVLTSVGPFCPSLTSDLDLGRTGVGFWPVHDSHPVYLRDRSSPFFLSTPSGPSPTFTSVVRLSVDPLLNWHHQFLSSKTFVVFTGNYLLDVWHWGNRRRKVKPNRLPVTVVHYPPTVLS